MVAFPVCTVLVYSSAIFALTKAQLLQNTTSHPNKLFPKATEAYLKITCLVLTVNFPRKIHPCKRKLSFAACTEWLLSAVPLVTLHLSVQLEQWSWLGWALPNLRTWNKMQP